MKAFYWSSMKLLNLRLIVNLFAQQTKYKSKTGSHFRPGDLDTGGCGNFL